MFARFTSISDRIWAGDGSMSQKDTTLTSAQGHVLTCAALTPHTAR